MAEYSKTSAVVLRTADYSESSQVVTLWTRDFGKVQAIAKGARRKGAARGGRGGAGMDLLNLCEVVLVRKPPPTLSLIAAWEVLDACAPLRSDLRRLYAGLYAAEFVARATEEGDPQPALFRLLVSFLRALAQNAAVYPALLRFELLLLEEVGLAPQLERCAGCDGPLGKGVAFSAAAGGTLCRDCARGHADATALEAQVAAAMVRLRAPGAKGSQSRLSAQAIRAIRRVLDEHIAYQFGRPLEMRKHVGPPGDQPYALSRTAARAESDHA